LGGEGWQAYSTTPRFSHSLMGLERPQSAQRVWPKVAPQEGQRAPVSKVSKGAPHRPQAQSAPRGGADRHDGQE
jgi:hypothetical protein